MTCPLRPASESDAIIVGTKPCRTCSTRWALGDGGGGLHLHSRLCSLAASRVRERTSTAQLTREDSTQTHCRSLCPGCRCCTTSCRRTCHRCRTTSPGRKRTFPVPPPSHLRHRSVSRRRWGGNLGSDGSFRRRPFNEEAGVGAASRRATAAVCYVRAHIIAHPLNRRVPCLQTAPTLFCDDFKCGMADTKVVLSTRGRGPTRLGNLSPLLNCRLTTNRIHTCYRVPHNELPLSL